MTDATILVVDDEQDLLEMVEILLRTQGYEVVTARNGMEGLMKASGERPDLILLDVMMDEMDGWEVLKLLKLDEETRAIPVVMLSARIEAKDKVRGLQEGALDYITKPFAVAKLLQTVQAVLDGRHESGLPEAGSTE